MGIDEIFANMLIELKRGTQILAVLSQLKEKQYGYSLLQCLDEKGTRIEAGTLYPLLRRLESQGLITSSWDTTESRPRKFYTLSREGSRIYILLKHEWKKIVLDINNLLEEE